jgi:hypothetical protein
MQNQSGFHLESRMIGSDGDALGQDEDSAWG